MRKRCALVRATTHAGSENRRKLGRAGPPQWIQRGGRAGTIALGAAQVVGEHGRAHWKWWMDP
jgi:hypothetical protein